jgi:hypothetical protein
MRSLRCFPLLSTRPESRRKPMAPTEENNNGDWEGIAPDDCLLNSPEEIEAFGQEYFAAEFPNPEREGCPSPKRLTAIARSGRAPDDELRTHLFTCSECFAEFREAMTVTAAVREPWPKRLFTLPWATPLRWAAPLAAVGLLLAVMFFVAQRGRQQPTRVATDHQPNVNTTEPTPRGQEFDTRSTDTSPLPSPSPQPLEHLAMRVVTVDLGADHLTRGADRSTVTQETIELRRERQRLRLTLPRGSHPGQYEVTLVDAFGKSVAVSQAGSHGKVIMTMLDLRKTEPGSYRLCAAREGEPPDCRPVALGR